MAHVSHKGSSQHVFNCLPKGQVFRDVIEFSPNACTGGPVVEELLDKMLGRGWYGGTFHGSIVHEGGGDQGMHQDQGEIPIDLQPNAPMKCLIIWTCSESSLKVRDGLLGLTSLQGLNTVVPGIYSVLDCNKLRFGTAAGEEK